MGRAGHASCACSILGANTVPSDNTSPARCFIAFSFCFCNCKKQVLCRLFSVLDFRRLAGACCGHCVSGSSIAVDAGLRCLQWLYQPAPCKGATMSTGHPASHIAPLTAQDDVDREVVGQAASGAIV